MHLTAVFRTRNYEWHANIYARHIMYVEGKIR